MAIIALGREKRSRNAARTAADFPICEPAAMGATSVIECRARPPNAVKNSYVCHGRTIASSTWTGVCTALESKMQLIILVGFIVLAVLAEVIFSVRRVLARATLEGMQQALGPIIQG